MQPRDRGAASLSAVLLQAVVLALIGIGIGVADSFLRPVNLKLEVRPGSDAGPTVIVRPLPPPANGGGTADPSPGELPAAEPEAPAAIAPPAAVIEAPAPAAPAAFRPANEEDLRGKPGHITLERAFDMHQFMGAVFLDARTAEEFAMGHVQGAHLAGLDRFRRGDVPPILMEIAKDAPIVVYCSGGADCEASEDVALHLNGVGFYNVHVLHDGIIGWQAVGYPVEVGAAK